MPVEGEGGACVVTDDDADLARAHCQLRLFQRTCLPRRPNTLYGKLSADEDLWVSPLKADAKPTKLGARPSVGRRFRTRRSPRGLTSNESGRFEVYVKRSHRPTGNGLFRRVATDRNITTSSPSGWPPA